MDIGEKGNGGVESFHFGAARMLVYCLGAYRGRCRYTTISPTPRYEHDSATPTLVSDALATSFRVDGRAVAIGYTMWAGKSILRASSD